MYEYVEDVSWEVPLEETLKGLLDYAVEKGACADDTASSDLFDTKLMGILTLCPVRFGRPLQSYTRSFL